MNVPEQMNRSRSTNQVGTDSVKRQASMLREPTKFPNGNSTLNVPATMTNQA